MRAAALVVIVGLLAAAAPVCLNVDDGSISLSSKTAYAQQGGGHGGANNGAGNAGGNNSGGNNSGGNSSGGNSSGGNNAGGNNAGGKGNPKGTVATDNNRDASLPRVKKGVALAQFTTKISKRYPTDRVSFLDNPHQAVSFFTEVLGMQGHTITHRWIYRGAVVYEASFKISGPKWKFWSTQVLPADKAGTWQVEVVDEGNKVLTTSRLDYRPVG